MPPEWWSGHDDVGIGSAMPKDSLNMPVRASTEPLMAVSDVEAYLWAKLFDAVPSAFWLDPYLWEPEKRPKPVAPRKRTINNAGEITEVSEYGQFKSKIAINNPTKLSFPNHPRTPTKDLYFEAKKEPEKPMFGPGVNITDPNTIKNNIKKEEKVNTSLDECPNCKSKDFTIVEQRKFKDPVTSKMVERIVVQCNNCGQKPRVTRPL